MGQAELARLVDVSPSSLNAWEVGRAGVHESNYQKLCMALPGLERAERPSVATGAMRGRKKRERLETTEVVMQEPPTSGTSQAATPPTTDAAPPPPAPAEPGSPAPEPIHVGRQATEHRPRTAEILRLLGQVKCAPGRDEFVALLRFAADEQLTIADVLNAVA
jgi:hypothetical protein